MALERLPRRRRKPTHDGPPRVIAYTRVSTEEQAGSRAGLDAQREALARAAEQRGWQVEWIEEPGVSAKSLVRPGLQRALDKLAAGEADVLAVSKLDRLSRSVHDFTGLVARAQREGWSLAILDLGLDMSTPQGSMMAGILAVFAEFERNMIGQRTRDGLAAKRAQGVKLGRPRVLPEPVRQRIGALRGDGLSYQAIADQLTSEQVPTAHGGQWYAATVRKVLVGE